MPFRDKKQRLAYRREWYSKNKDSERAHIKRRKLEIRKWFEEYKKTLKCSRCSEGHPATIDFHHKQGKKKEQGISFMVSNGYSIKRILQELNNCVILCSNCHRKLHHRKRQTLKVF